MKNLLLATVERRILYLGQTHEGSKSEKRMADEEDFDFCRAHLLEILLDLGFPAYQAKGAVVIRPHKKPRGGTLSQQQKQENQQQARERVVAQGMQLRG